jgi:hypothetical protein
MKKILTISVFLLSITLLTSCGNRVYNNQAFINQNNLNDKTVAILPVDVILTGNMPKNFSEEQKINQQNLESKYFQDMLYAEFLDKSMAKNKGKSGVNFINPNQVNSKLKTNGVATSSLKDKTYQDLSKTVDADMLILVSIKKNRLVSDAAALGIDIAGNVLNSIFRSNPNNNTGNNTQNSTTRTYDIALDLTLADGATGTVISKFSTIRQITWQTNPETEIRRNFRVTTRKFAIRAN